nr:MAG TPA: hypothetical protein [Caudoviricetes sp.]
MLDLQQLVTTLPCGTQKITPGKFPGVFYFSNRLTINAKTIAIARYGASGFML